MIPSLRTATCVALVALTPPLTAQQVLRCESHNFRRQYCQANTAGGVSLRTQRSSEGCWQGDTWGFDHNGVWVTNGCRADFTIGTPSQQTQGSGMSGKDKAIAGAVVGGIAAAIIAAAVVNRNNNNHNNDNGYPVYPGGPGFGSQIYCASDDGRYNTCQAGRIRYAEMRRQRSGSPCIFNQTWGYNRNIVWVDRGCRAEFWVR